MDSPLLALPLLALVDSTSFGTLLIPVWLMTARQVLVRQHLLYLAVVGACYWALGLALAFGLAAVWDDVRALLDAPAALAVQLALGVVLLVVAVLPSSGARSAGRDACPAGAASGSPRAPRRARSSSWRSSRSRSRR
jgi:hypothetical protein